MSQTPLAYISEQEKIELVDRAATVTADRIYEGQVVVPAPSSGPEAVNVDYLNTAMSDLAKTIEDKDNFKRPVAALANSNLVLSGEQTVDGVDLTTGQRVAVTGQENPMENGIYVVAADGWTRSDDMAIGDGVASHYFVVQGGDQFADTRHVVSNDSGLDIVGTHQIEIVQYRGAEDLKAGNGVKIDGLVVSTTETTALDRGTIDVDEIASKRFALSANPKTNTLSFTSGGVAQDEGDDFEVIQESGNYFVSWAPNADGDTFGLDGLIAVGHKVSARYIRLV